MYVVTTLLLANVVNVETVGVCLYLQNNVRRLFKMKWKSSKSVVKWNEVKWTEVKWSEVKWSEM